MVFFSLLTCSYFTDAIAKLTAIIHHPKALLPRKVMVHEAAIFALARICFFQFREIKTPEVDADGFFPLMFLS